MCTEETEMLKSSRTFTPQFYKLAQGHPSVTNSNRVCMHVFKESNDGFVCKIIQIPVEN